MFGSILLCSDGSEGALKAVRMAADLAATLDAQVTLLHVNALCAGVHVGVSTLEEGLPPGALERYMAEVRDSAVGRAGQVLDDAGVLYRVREETGHPADVIVRVAEQGRFDLVVLGSRGMSPLRSFLVGSVSDRVAHYAHCPVLIVR